MSLRDYYMRGGPPPVIEAYVYIDAGYGRPEMTKAGLPEEFDPRGPARVLSRERLARQSFTPPRIFYYDAVDGSRQDEAERLEAHLQRLERLPDTHVVTGFVRYRRSGRQHKAVDVRLAVDALEAAYQRRVPAIGLVAGDADFAPLAAAIRRAGPPVIVLAFRNSLAGELQVAADRVVYLPSPPPTDWVLKAEPADGPPQFTPARWHRRHQRRPVGPPAGGALGVSGV